MGKPPPPPGPKPPPPPGSDRRRAERVELLAQVELRSSGGELTLLPIVNISIGGALVRIEDQIAARDVRIGDPVSVFLDLGADASFTLDADVVRVEIDGLGRSAGIALMWTTKDPSVLQKLASALRQLK